MSYGHNDWCNTMCLFYPEQVKALEDAEAAKSKSASLAERAVSYSTPQRIATRPPPVVEQPSDEPECDACGGPDCACED